METGIGLYIHIPFCRQKCAYCDFYSVLAQPGAIDRYLNSLAAEMRLQGQGQLISTVFLGGGTPSLLTARQISTVLDGVSRYFLLAKDAEISMEANPETLLNTDLAAYRVAGINRLSLGVQVLDNDLLPHLGRRHTAQDALTIITRAQAAGFTNLSCDLIYGIPGQTMVGWQHDLQTITARGLPHLSLYCLEVHDETPLGQAINSGKMQLPDPDLAADMYDWAREFLPQQGLVQYEISNFSRPGFECRHNLIYWHNDEYLGLGPAACSYRSGVRACNVADMDTYACKVQSLSAHMVPLANVVFRCFLTDTNT